MHVADWVLCEVELELEEFCTFDELCELKKKWFFICACLLSVGSCNLSKFYLDQVLQAVTNSIVMLEELVVIVPSWGSFSTVQPGIVPSNSGRGDSYYRRAV